MNQMMTISSNNSREEQIFETQSDDEQQDISQRHHLANGNTVYGEHYSEVIYLDV